MNYDIYQITIIVPIYKVEKFIGRCINSLLNQDFENIEYIFINDCTPDKSFEIVKQNIFDSNRKNDIVLLENENNLGVSKTRKKGMLAARGKYVIQIDADDWIEPNMISSLYKKIELDQNDIIICDYYISFLNKKVYRKQEYRSDIDFNLKSIMRGKVYPSFCNTLIKRSFYLENNFLPTGEVNMGEDFETLFRIFSQTNKVSYIPKPFVYYTQYNTQSITKTMNESHIRDTIHSINLFEDTLSKFGDKYEQDFRIMLVFWKKMFLLNKKYENYFYTIRPDANKFKYLFSENSYGIFQKIAITFSLLKIPLLTRLIYKTYRYFKKNF